MNKKTRIFSILSLVAVFCLSIAFTACSVSVEGITLNQETAAMKVGETLTLTATVTPEDASNPAVIWSSSDEQVLTVSDGVITAVANGTATVTAQTQDGGFTSSCAITVTTDVTGVLLDSAELTIPVGQEDTLTATVSPATASEKGLIWSSSNEAIATVDGGKVTAVSAGSAIITVETVNGGYTATCNVAVVIPVTGVALNEDQTTLEVGSERTLVATISPDNATEKGIMWSSSNETVASVVDGKVVALAAGKTTVSAETVDGNFVDSCEITVIVSVTGVAIEGAQAAVKQGATLQLSAQINPVDATNKNVTWYSSNEKIASVDAGLVTALEQGEVTIIVKTEDGEFSAQVDIRIIGFDNKEADLNGSAQLLQGFVSVNNPINSLVSYQSEQNCTMYYVLSAEKLTRSQLINNAAVISVPSSSASALLQLKIESQEVTSMQYLFVSGDGEFNADTLVSDVMTLSWTASQFFTPVNGTITTWAQLKEALAVDQDIVLGANIDAGSEVYTPTLNEYKHTFDGKGFAILNLNVVANGNNAGLFKQACTPAVFKDVLFIDAQLTANEGENVGLLFGTNTEPADNIITISGVEAYGLKVVGTKPNVGGLVGWIKGAAVDLKISNCYVDMSADYQGEKLGGILGLVNWNSKITVENTIATVSITKSEKQDYGGFIGLADAATISVSGGKYSLTATNCTGSLYGGFAGRFDGNVNATVSGIQAIYNAIDCKANRAGGFAGGCFGNANVNLSISRVDTHWVGGEQDERKAGFIGQSDGNATMTVSNCEIEVIIEKDVTAVAVLIGACDGSSTLYAEYVFGKIQVIGNVTANAINDVFGYYGGANATDGVKISNSVMMASHRSSDTDIYGQKWNDPPAPVTTNLERINITDKVSAASGELFTGAGNGQASYWNYSDGVLKLALK